MGFASRRRSSYIQICAADNCTAAAVEDGLCKYHHSLRLQKPRDDDDDFDIPRRRRRDPDEEYRHPGRKLMQLMQETEDARQIVSDKEKALREHLDANPDLKLLWEDFQRRGGSTVRELAQWLSDDDWHRKDMVLRHKHLRLISSTPAAKRRRLKDDDPKDACREEIYRR